MAETVTELLKLPIQNLSKKGFEEAINNSIESATDRNALLLVFKTITGDESQFHLSEIEQIIAKADLGADSWMHKIKDKLSGSDLALLEAVTTEQQELLLQQIENSRQKTAVRQIFEWLAKAKVKKEESAQRKAMEEERRKIEAERKVLEVQRLEHQRKTEQLEKIENERRHEEERRKIEDERKAFELQRLEHHRKLEELEKIEGGGVRRIKTLKRSLPVG